jgi:hypothetical protein
MIEGTPNVIGFAVENSGAVGGVTAVLMTSLPVYGCGVELAKPHAWTS